MIIRPPQFWIGNVELYLHILIRHLNRSYHKSNIIPRN